MSRSRSAGRKPSPRSKPPSPPRASVGRPPNTSQRRAQIVDALLSVMAREGYSGATIARVARQAGLTSGLIHYHFTSKEQILLAAVETMVARVEERAASRLGDTSGAPRQRLHAYTDAHVSRGADADPSAVAAWVVIGAEAMRQPEVQAIYAKALTDAYHRTKGLVRDCLKEDGRVTRNAGLLAGAIVAAIEGLYRLGIATPALLSSGSAAPTMRRLVDGLLAAEAQE